MTSAGTTIDIVFIDTIFRYIAVAGETTISLMNPVDNVAFAATASAMHPIVNFSVWGFGRLTMPIIMPRITSAGARKGMFGKIADMNATIIPRINAQLPNMAPACPSFFAICSFLIMKYLNLLFLLSRTVSTLVIYLHFPLNVLLERT